MKIKNFHDRLKEKMDNLVHLIYTEKKISQRGNLWCNLTITSSGTFNNFKLY